MTKLEKPHYRKLKAQRKENTGAWSLGCESIELAKLEGELWAPNSNLVIGNVLNLLHSEEINVKLQVLKL